MSSRFYKHDTLELKKEHNAHIVPVNGRQGINYDPTADDYKAVKLPVAGFMSWSRDNLPDVSQEINNGHLAAVVPARSGYSIIDVDTGGTKDEMKAFLIAKGIDPDGIYETTKGIHAPIKNTLDSGHKKWFDSESGFGGDWIGQNYAIMWSKDAPNIHLNFLRYESRRVEIDPTLFVKENQSANLHNDNSQNHSLNSSNGFQSKEANLPNSSLDGSFWKHVDRDLTTVHNGERNKHVFAKMVAYGHSKDMTELMDEDYTNYLHALTSRGNAYNHSLQEPVDDKQIEWNARYIARTKQEGFTVFSREQAAKGGRNKAALIRDAMTSVYASIYALRRKGWTLRKIASKVSLSFGYIGKVLKDSVKKTLVTLFNRNKDLSQSHGLKVHDHDSSLSLPVTSPSPVSHTFTILEDTRERTQTQKTQESPEDTHTLNQMRGIFAGLVNDVSRKGW